MLAFSDQILGEWVIYNFSTGVPYCDPRPYSHVYHDFHSVGELGNPAQIRNTMLTAHSSSTSSSHSSLIFDGERCLSTANFYGTDEADIVHKLSVDLNHCSTWLNDHRFALNVGKTKLMFFGTAAKTGAIQTNVLEFNGGSVYVVNEYKYLGMMLDCRLRFDKHAKYVRSKIIPKMKTLGKIRKFVNRSTALYLYSSLIKPVFEYNDYIYYPMTADDANSLEVLQNNCLRICLQTDKYTSRRNLYLDSGVCSLAENRENHTSKMVYLGLAGKSTDFVNQLFKRVSDIHDINIRASTQNHLSIPRSKLECCKGNIAIRGPTYYNKLPEDIRQSSSVEVLKHKLKQQNHPT